MIAVKIVTSMIGLEVYSEMKVAKPMRGLATKLVIEKAAPLISVENKYWFT